MKTNTENTASAVSGHPLFTKTPIILLMAGICCLLWGSAYPCIKICYALFGIASNDPAGQILIAGIRFFIAGFLALIIGSITAKRVLIPKRTSWPKIVILSLLQTVIQYIFFYVGLAHADSAKSAVINACSVFITIGLSALVYHQEKLTLPKIIGSVLGIIGVILINLSGSGFSLDLTLTGEGFILISGVAYSFSSIYLKKFSRDEDPVILSGAQFVVGGLILIIAGLLGGGRVVPTSASGILMMLYMAFISAVAYSLWGILLKHNPVSRIAVFSFLTPVFGFILSCLLVGSAQTVGLKGIVALIFICLGIYIVNRMPKAE